MVGDGTRFAIAAEVDDIELGERRRADEFVEDDDADIEAGGAHFRKLSCVSECSLDDVDLEAGLAKIIKGSPDPEKAKRNCRICHLGLESAAAESGADITLGCSCKVTVKWVKRQSMYWQAAQSQLRQDTEPPPKGCWARRPAESDHLKQRLML